MSFNRYEKVIIIAGKYAGTFATVCGFNCDKILVRLGIEHGNKHVTVYIKDCTASK